MRNITAHTYDHEKAQQVYRDTLVFINDARALLKALEVRNA
jgi:Nucleotidyltransferase substrate binding protein like